MDCVEVVIKYYKCYLVLTMHCKKNSEAWVNIANSSRFAYPLLECCNLVPRVFSAFKMAARRRPWQTAGHVTTKLANREPVAILKQSRETRDLLFAMVFFAPTRHLESGDGSGDEVVNVGQSCW